MVLTFICFIKNGVVTQARQVSCILRDFQVSLQDHKIRHALRFSIIFHTFSEKLNKNPRMSKLKNRSILRTLTNISDKSFCENGQRLRPASYFHKKSMLYMLHLSEYANRCIHKTESRRNYKTSYRFERLNQVPKKFSRLFRPKTKVPLLPDTQPTLKNV